MDMAELSRRFLAAFQRSPNEASARKELSTRLMDDLVDFHWEAHLLEVEGFLDLAEGVRRKADVYGKLLSEFQRLEKQLLGPLRRPLQKIS